ncbi:aminoglycoside phosphotransferase family protein [Leifsonia poae]|uniref:Aminoglycoside phosphotransferase n=1 Tax=Leifsonia poae TaxID=110933 RepID=A0A9W6LYN0_9MICO|nr:aminoglycoside phosphotransferase family protein [Leifsonia poae]GLJ74774.1 aminoglycoside phosphotransferase [Leifsonia poae]
MSSGKAFDRDSIDLALARRLVDAQFPAWRELPIRPVALSGWDNRTFRLGDELSIRMPTGPWYAQQVAKEQTWLPRLAPVLPLPIPTPVAVGEPGDGYPFPWSVYRWIAGEPAASAGLGDAVAFGEAVGGFLVALRGADARGGPAPGEHNFFRGDPPAVYAEETERAIAALGREGWSGAAPGADADWARGVWADALDSLWGGDPVWLHGDIAVGNLLMRDGRLSAVIDFGTSGVGDPACDLVLAWTSLEGAGRSAFRRGVGLDDATWARAKGWALWKALIVLAEDRGSVEARTTLARLRAA